MAYDLCSKGLIAREARDKAVHTVGMTPMEKAAILLNAVEGAIVSDDNSKKPFMKLCSVLKKYKNMRHVEQKLRKGEDVRVN